MSRASTLVPRPPTTRKSRFWRLCRIYFRRFRIAMWVIVLVLAGSLLYVNQVGLPNFIKNPLLRRLRAQGIDLEFSRLRWRWYQGIVAENVRFGRAADALSPKLTLDEVQVRLNPRALAKLQFQVDSLFLRQGRLVWPIAETNSATAAPGWRQLSLDNIHTNLRLLPNDQWALDNFRAAFAGGNIELSGTVSNASAVRDWKFFQGQQPAPPGALQNRLRRLADALERTHFSAPPDLKLDIQGDARDLQSFLIRIRLTAPGSETPWGTFNNGLFTARLLPATKNGSVRAELNLEAAEAQTQWAATTNLHLAIHLASIEGQTNLVQGHLSLVAGVVQTTNWGKAMSITNADFTAQWIHALTNPIPISGQGHLLCETADTQWGAARKIDLNTRLLDPATIPQSAVSAPHSSLPDWVTNLEPHALDWQCHLTNLRSPKLELDELALSGTWRFPQLTITIPQAQLYQGEIAARATLDVLSRKVTANVASDCDLHLASALLTDFGRRWLAQFSWTKPPEIAADLSFVLPDWESDAWRVTNDEQLSSPATPHSPAAPNSDEGGSPLTQSSSPVTRHSPLVTHLLPTFQLEGQFKVDHGGAFNDVPASAARGHVSYSNMTWRLPDLAITRPEGRIDVFHQANDRTKDYYWKFHSTIDVTSIRPLLETNQQRALDYLSFAQPPVIDAEVWGRWHDHSRTGVKAEVALTNFTFRGQAANSFQTALQYTNRLLQLTNAQAWIGTQLLSATSLAVDYVNQKIYLTNGFSTADPRIVTRAIGPKVDAAIEPYVFSRRPTARVYGIIPIASENDADLHFDIDGGPFHWMRFNLEHVAGHIDWKGQHLALRNVRANLYGGYASGSAEFDFRAQRGTDYRFDLITTNAQLKWIMADLSTHTNNLEGMLNGTVVVNSANSADWRSWQGAGDVNLQDGLIWEIPAFGLFSPILNGIAPGLGNSRASAATGTFMITNGVIYTDDLEIRTSGARLDYRGTVDFQGQLNARVDAQLLRDIWGIGPLISTVFWPVTKLFEYKVTGPLSQPKPEPVFFIPKIVLMPFHPFRTLRELFPEEPAATTTNAPPLPPSPP